MDGDWKTVTKFVLWPRRTRPERDGSYKSAWLEYVTLHYQYEAPQSVCSSGFSGWVLRDITREGWGQWNIASL